MLAVLLIYMAGCIATGITQSVRLINGSSSKEGRLEIFYSGIWGTVCDDWFTDVDARVACASLGYGYNGTFISNRYGAGSGQIWLDDVNCTGAETGIEQCDHPPWGVHNCGHQEDVSIRCGCDSKNFSGPTGQFSSQNFPMEYDNNLDCSNYITIPFGQTIVITFTAFNTESCCDWVTITCYPESIFRSPRYSGFDFPAVLTISSCSLVNVSFHTDGSVTATGFNLTYTIISDTVNGGVTMKPSIAFPRSDTIEPIILNCTSTTKYLPWWKINIDSNSINYTITNSTCGLITSAPYSSWFISETLGPGTCNLIVITRGYNLSLLAGSLVCTDSTLVSRRAILAPINIDLRLTKGVNSSAIVTDLIRDEEIKISCNLSFTLWYSNPSVFAYFTNIRSTVVQLRILRTYWTTLGSVVPSTGVSNSSSYVLVKAPVGRIPSYKCNVVCDFFSNISDASGDSRVEIAFNTESVDVFYWPTEDTMTITGDNNGQIRIPALLNCYAAANPAVSYTWIDESNGNITSGPTVVIVHGGKYTCNASNLIRGKYYGQSKSVNLQVIEDDTDRLKLVAIILGALLGAAVLTIIIIAAILIIRRCRQQRPNAVSASDVGHTNPGRPTELELRQIREENNRYERGPENTADIANTDYENLNMTSRRFPSMYPDCYEELGNRR